MSNFKFILIPSYYVYVLFYLLITTRSPFPSSTLRTPYDVFYFYPLRIISDSLSFVSTNSMDFTLRHTSFYSII